jgi:hypothetical protein
MVDAASRAGTTTDTVGTDASLPALGTHPAR